MDGCTSLSGSDTKLLGTTVSSSSRIFSSRSSKQKLNYQYFSLSQTGVAWEAVTRARNLAAYVPGDFNNPQLELIILLPEG